MKQKIIIALLLTCFAGQCAATQEDYAKEAVATARQFVKLELQGGRLSSEGWRSAGSRFFLRPGPPPVAKEIRIVSDRFFVKLDSFTTTADATVEASFAGCYGTIDSQLRFKAPPQHAQHGVAVVSDCWSTYKLVLSPWYWQQERGKESRKPTDGTPMRIVDSEIGAGTEHVTFMLDRSAATRYLLQTRQQTTDPTLRKNADAALARLRQLRN